MHLATVSWANLFVSEFGNLAHHAVYIFNRVWLVVFDKEDENVCMRQPTLLKFNDIDSRNRVSHNMVLVNVIDELLQFDFEHSGYQIELILRLLSE